jgi:hypothetical protein
MSTSAFITGLPGITSTCVDNNNNLYVSNFNLDVRKFDAITGSPILFTISQLTEAYGVRGVIVGNNNDLYTISYSEGVNKYNSITGELITYAILPPSASQYFGCLDSNNNLYISSVGNSQIDSGFISKYTASNSSITTYFVGSAGTYGNVLFNPNGLYVDINNILYVSNEGGSTTPYYIGKYNALTGETINAQFITLDTSPGSITGDNNNNLFISNGTVISQYDSVTGNLINSNYATGLFGKYSLSSSSSYLYYGSSANNIAKYILPSAIPYSTKYGGNTYYYDICGNDLYNNFSLSSLISTGSQIPFIGKAGQAYSPNFDNTTISTLTLNLPTAITFDATYNNAYICSTFMGVIYRLNMYTGVVNLIAGTYSTGTIVSTPVSSYSSVFTYPTGTAFDNSGNFYICDNTAKQIVKMNLQTSMITNIVFSPPTALPLYLLVDSANNLYFSSTIGIYKVSLLGTLPAGSAATIDSSNIYQMAFAPRNKNLIYGISPSSPAVIRVSNITTSSLSYSITMPTGINQGQGIVFDSTGNLYFCTRTTVYMITPANIPTVTTTNFTNYTTVSSIITYNSLRWLSIDNADNLYITDTNGHVIYKYITNTYNTKYLLPNGLDLGTLFLPKYMLGGTSSQVTSFPLSNYIIDSTNSPIEYYIEGATYNIIDNSGLICHYMFNYQDISGLNLANYASGSIVYDASLSVVGLGYQADYVVGNGCLNLNNATSQYVNINNTNIRSSSWPTTGGLTFAMWINTSSANGQYSRIFEFGNGYGTNTVGLISNWNGGNSGNGDVIYMNVNKGTTPYNNPSTSLVITGIWTHIVWTLSYATASLATSNWNLYINGVLKTTLTGQYYPDIIARNSCYLGYNYGYPFYNGQIDDFRVYNCVIKAKEAFQLYSFNGLSLYYKFDAEDIFKGDGISIANYASGYPLYDASLSAVNSQINGISTTSSMVGNACMCLSTNYVNIPNPNISTNGFTAAFWMNTTSTAQNYPPLFYLNGNTTYNVYIYITNIGGTAYSIGYECRCNGTTLRTLLYTTITINDGAWHYIVVTSTYAALGSLTSTIRIYIDNVLNSSTTTGYYPNNAGLMSSGSTIGGGTPAYNGLIDDYRVYARVLSSAEITALYTFTYSPGKLAVTAIGAATFTVTTPKYLGITATVTTNPPATTHADTVTNSIYKTVLTGLSLNVGYGYTFTYTNGLVLTGNTRLYSAPAAPTLTITGNITTGTTVTTQSYSGIATTAAYFYTNNVVFQGTYTSGSYIGTITGLSAGNSYPLISNILNNSSIGQTKSTVYTLPSIPTIAVTTVYSNSVVFTFTSTDSVALTNYYIVINGQTFTSATSTVTATGLLQNTSYSYYGYVTNTAGNSANTTATNVTTGFKATGGDTTYIGNGYRYHIFTSTSGTFSTSTIMATTTFNIIAVGGGGGGGGGANFTTYSNCGGGGGAGAYYQTSMNVSSLNINIKVGLQGSGGNWYVAPQSGFNGGNTIVSGTSSAGSISYTVYGGGGGGAGSHTAGLPTPNVCAGLNGGSGGGGGTCNNNGTPSTISSGGTASNSSGVGKNGGTGIGNSSTNILFYNAAGGGGGALSDGSGGIFTNANPYRGNGGNGTSITVYNNITPIIYYLSAGGGGGTSAINVANGGLVGGFMAGGSGEYTTTHATYSRVSNISPPGNCYGCGGGGCGGGYVSTTQALAGSPGSQGIVIIYYAYP